jgi:hypothetical protein
LQRRFVKTKKQFTISVDNPVDERRPAKSARAARAGFSGSPKKYAAKNRA